MPRVATLLPVREQAPLLKYMAPCETWALSTYKACEFRCVYCITGAQGTSAPQYPKAQVAVQLRRELGAIDAEASIGVGSLCDAYPSVELRYDVTRAAIEGSSHSGAGSSSSRRVQRSCATAIYWRRTRKRA
jgi:DNA repair photolyase